MANVKSPDGGFFCGDGLKVDGKTISATGGGGGGGASELVTLYCQGMRETNGVWTIDNAHKGSPSGQRVYGAELDEMLKKNVVPFIIIDENWGGELYNVQAYGMLMFPNDTGDGGHSAVGFGNVGNLTGAPQQSVLFYTRLDTDYE